MKNTPLLAAALATFLAVGSASAQTFLWNSYNESSFNEGFASGNSVTVSAPANSRLTLFTSSFAPIALASGSTRQIDFSFSTNGGFTAHSNPSTSTTRAFQFGFFNDGGTTTGASRFADDAGYLVRWNPNGAGNGFLEFHERPSGAVNSLYVSNGSSSLGVGSNSAAVELLDNTTYTASLRLVRAAGGAFSLGTSSNASSYGASISGLPAVYYGFSGSDSSPVTTINQFAVLFHNTTGSAASYTLTVDANTLAGNFVAIPEPSSYAGLAGLVGLGLVAARRRKSRPAE